MVQKKNITVGRHCLALRVGLDTGPCLAGVVGRSLPRYCLFGDVIRIASKVMHYSLRNRVHVSYATARSLRKHDVFLLRSRGNIQTKDKDLKRTFWLEGVTDREELDKILARRVDPHAEPLRLNPRAAAKLQSHFGIHLDRQMTTTSSWGTVYQGSRLTDASFASFLSKTLQKKSVSDQQEPGRQASMDDVPPARHAWDQPPDYRKEKGVGRKRIRSERRLLGSLSETVSLQSQPLYEQIEEVGSHPVESVLPSFSNTNTNVATQRISTDPSVSSAVMAKAAMKDTTTDEACADNNTAVPGDDETRVSCLSRASSLETQLSRRFSKEAGVRKGSWPDWNTNSSVETPQKNLTAEQQVYSLSGLPGTGDIKARLKWELQQASWFLEFARPSSLRTQSLTSEELNEKESTGTQPTKRCSSFPIDIQSGASQPDASQPVTDSLTLTPCPVSLHPTPANSSCHSFVSVRSTASMENLDDEAI